MRDFDKIIWIDWINPNTFKGGGGVYSNTVLHALQNTYPNSDIIRLHRNSDGYVNPLQKIKKAAVMNPSLPLKITFGLDNSVAVRLNILTSSYPNSLIVFNGGETFGYMDYVSSGTKMHISHNIEHQLYGDRISNAKYPVEIIATIMCERRKYKKFEIEHLAQCEFATFISSEDCFVFTSLLGNRMPKSTVLSPSFFGRQTHVHKNKNGKSVSFMADFTWSPNVQGIKHFIENRWNPKEHDTLHLFGKGSEDFEDKNAKIKAHGWVPDLKVVWELSDVMIAPIYWGSGVNIKTCEAIYQGIPLVSTPMAVRGIPDFIKSEVSVLKSDDDWMDEIHKAAPPSKKSSDFFSSSHSNNLMLNLFTQNEAS